MREINSKIISRLIQIADESPEKLALLSENEALTYKELLANVYDLADWLQQSRKKCVAVYVENNFEWVIINLACIVAGITHIALPDFFSNQQLRHIFNTAHPDTIISDRVTRLLELGLKFISCSKVSGLNVLSLVPKNDHASKYSSGSNVTFIPGSNGNSKGTCLDQYSIDQLTFSLKERLDDLSIKQHVCVLPLSTLLENIAGIYVPLVMGSTVYVTPVWNLGFNNCSGVDTDLFIKKLGEIKPDSLLLPSQLLSILVAHTMQAKSLLCKPEFLVVVGSTVLPSIINTARELGWSAYAGYVLSEYGMLVSMNVPGMDRIGSVGKPLPHIKVEIINDEICLSGLHCCANPDEVETNDGYLHTGDRGYLDDEGYLYVSGRK